MTPQTILDNAISKSKTNPEFHTDLVKYMKYLVLKDISDDQIPELNVILNSDDLSTFFDFSVKIIPNFSQHIIEYISSY